MWAIAVGVVFSLYAADEWAGLSPEVVDGVRFARGTTTIPFVLLALAWSIAPRALFRRGWQAVSTLADAAAIVTVTDASSSGTTAI